MTKTQRRLIAEAGPYTLGRDGWLRDVNGACFMDLGQPLVAWDRAAVAALNDVVKRAKKEG